MPELDADGYQFFCKMFNNVQRQQQMGRYIETKSVRVIHGSETEVRFFVAGSL